VVNLRYIGWVTIYSREVDAGGIEKSSLLGLARLNEVDRFGVLDEPSSMVDDVAGHLCLVGREPGALHRSRRVEISGNTQNKREHHDGRE
jgi:hypothetical protein